MRATEHRSVPPGGADTRPLGWPYLPHFWLGWPREVMRPGPQGQPASRGWEVALDLEMAVHYIWASPCALEPPAVTVTWVTSITVP